MPIVSVLWGIGLLTIVSVSMMWSSNVSYRLARNVIETANSNALFEAAINRAVLALIEPGRDRRWRTDGTPQTFEFNGAPIKVSIQDELGRIDLNRADVELLAGLFRSTGLDEQASVGMVDKILDWRSSGNLKHLNGAKADDYRLAGYSNRPRNGPFQSVGELMLVMNMTPALFKRIAPAVTVYSGRQFIDPQVAPREALLALPNMDEAKVSSALAARLQSDGGTSTGSTGTMLSLQGRAFTIRAEIPRSAGALIHEAAIRLTDNPVQPYWILNWQDKADIQ
jgi:general secretion pathway protein K